MKDNIKRLHKHYSEIGYTKAQLDLEAKYPELKDKEPTTSPQKPVEETSSKTNSKPNTAKKKADSEAKNA